jgi:hypothetical protein
MGGVTLWKLFATIPVHFWTLFAGYKSLQLNIVAGLSTGKLKSCPVFLVFATCLLLQWGRDLCNSFFIPFENSIDFFKARWVYFMSP